MTTCVFPRHAHVQAAVPPRTSPDTTHVSMRAHAWMHAWHVCLRVTDFPLLLFEVLLQHLLTPLPLFCCQSRLPFFVPFFSGRLFLTGCNLLTTAKFQPPSHNPADMPQQPKSIGLGARCPDWFESRFCLTTAELRSIKKGNCASSSSRLRLRSFSNGT